MSAAEMLSSRLKYALDVPDPPDAPDPQAAPLGPIGGLKSTVPLVVSGLMFENDVPGPS